MGMEQVPMIDDRSDDRSIAGADGTGMGDTYEGREAVSREACGGAWSEQAQV